MKKIILYILILSQILMATTCEDEDNECHLTENSINDNVNVITLTPLQSIYNQGDELTLEISIPATNTYFGKELNLYEVTEDNSASMILLSADIFYDNILNVIEGSQGRHPNWFNLTYNLESEMYELKVKVLLNRIGLYSHHNGGVIEFGTSDCPDYRLNINTSGVDEVIEFSVIE